MRKLLSCSILTVLLLATVSPTRAQSPSEEIEGSRGEAVHALRRARLAMMLDGDTEAATRLVQEALVFGEQTGDALVLAYGKMLIGEIEFALGDHDKAIASFETAVGSFQKLHSRQGRLGLAGSHFNLGRLLAAAGRIKEALEHQQSSLELYESLNHKRALADTCADLGETLRALGRTEQAVGVLERALGLYAPDATGRLRALTSLGCCQLDQGYDAAALESFQAAQLMVTGDDPAEQADVHNALGMAYHRQGLYEEALRSYQVALEICTRQTHNQAAEALIRNNLGGLYYDQGEPDKALTELDRASKLCVALNDPPGQARALYNIAVIRESLGDDTGAIGAYERALAVRRKTNDNQGAARILENLALLYAAQGMQDKARESRAEAERLRVGN